MLQIILTLIRSLFKVSPEPLDVSRHIDARISLSRISSPSLIPGNRHVLASVNPLRVEKPSGLSERFAARAEELRRLVSVSSY